MDKKEINNILKEIGFPPSEILVYIALLDGAESVKEIMRITGEKRPTIYYSLNSLEKRGLVSKTGKEYGNKFQLEPVDKLIELVNNNIRKQTNILEKVGEIKKFYPKNGRSNKVLVSYFDNKESIKSAILYSIYTKKKEIKTIVPGENMFNDLGVNFITEYVKQKKDRKIKTFAIWEDIPSPKIINEYYSDSEIRQMPVDIHNSFKTTVFIYDNKTLYIGPEKESYAVLIESVEHTKMMLSLFDNLWNSSYKLK